MTTWYPDTCGCVLEYTDDGNFTFIQTKNACVKHAPLAGTANHLATVFTHNRAKNTAAQWVDSKFTLTVRGFYNPSTGPVAVDPVQIAGHGMTGQTLINAQSQVDAHFGAGNVVLVPGT